MSLLSEFQKTQIIFFSSQATYSLAGGTKLIALIAKIIACCTKYVAIFE